MATKLSFGKWVKQQRKALDLTQHALAQRIGCALSTIQKIEIDARQPSPQMAELLADQLELAPDERSTFLHLARHQTSTAAPDLPIVVPPQVPSHPLPTPLTTLIGREWEVMTVRTTLLHSAVRLLTLTGPPGIGKTRLGLQVASEIQSSFADGVVFVALAPISDATFVAATIMRALGIKDTGNQSLLAQLKAYLRAKQLLLVLDNFEHVLPAAPLIAELLEAAPHLKVMATSRALLQLYGEHEFVTPPLALPDLSHLPTPEKLTRYAAVDLFVQRARAARLEFVITAENAPYVAELCVRLDGLPLAIELAAARSKMLTPAALLARLVQPAGMSGTQLRLLVGGARNLSPRHRTLRNAIAWSYDLLTPTEQRLFRSLGVFAGGCTLDGLAAVVSAQLALLGEPSSLATHSWLWDTMLALVNQSLVIHVQDPDAEPRLTLLEMMREYALEQLEAHGERTTAHHAHALYYVALAERFKTASAEDNEAPLISRMELEINNLRAALRWADEHDFALVLRFIIAMTDYWSQRRHLSEGRQWLEQLQTRIKAMQPPLLPHQKTDYARISGNLAFFTWLQGDNALAQNRWEETVERWRELQNWHEMGLALSFLACTFYDRGDYAAANASADESVAILRKSGEAWALGWALCTLGSIMIVNQEYTKAHTFFDEALAIFHRIGHTWSISLAGLGLSDLFFAQGNLERARTCLEEILPEFQNAEQLWMMTQTIYLLGKVHWRQGDKQRAIVLWNESVTLAREISAKRFLAEIYCMLGLAAQERNDRQQAQIFFFQSFTLYQAVENKIGAAYALCGLASLAEQPVTQAQLLGAAATVLDHTRLPYDAIERTHYEQTVAAVRGQLDESTFAAAWAQGQAMSLTQALALCGDDEYDSALSTRPLKK